jgi:hypothetical protein
VFGMKADLVATKDCQLSKTAVMVVIQCKRKER